MTYYSKIPVGSLGASQTEQYERHSSQTSAAIRVRFAVMGGSAKTEECGIYRRDPRKHPTAENMLPALIARANRSRKGR